MYFPGGPNEEDYSIWGSLWGSAGKLPYEGPP